MPSQSSEHFVETLDAHGGSLDHYVLEVDGHVPDPWHNAGRDLLNSNQNPFQMHQSGRFLSRARKGEGGARAIPAFLVASVAFQLLRLFLTYTNLSSDLMSQKT